MTGQVLTRKDNENGGCTVTLSEFVTVEVSIEGTFKNATIVNTTPQTITLNGDVKSTNILDLGIWLSNAGLLHFKYYVNTPGNPIMAYVHIDENGVSNLSFKNVGLENDTLDALRIPLNREPRKSTPYTFTGMSTPPNVANPNSVILTEPVPMSYSTYGLIEDHLTIRKMPLESLDRLRVDIMPDEPPMDEPEDMHEEDMHDEAPPQDEQPEDSNPEG